MILVHDKTKEKWWVIVEKVKERPYLMNPAGYSWLKENSEETAVREIKEELDLKIQKSDLHSLAKFEFKTKFANLDWINKTDCFFTTISLDCLPKKWKVENCIDSKIRTIDIDDNEEVEKILLVSAEQLQDISLMKKIEFTGHHLLLAQEAIRRENPKLAGMSHLLRFNWC